MSRTLLALDPRDVGGVDTKATFARALVERCIVADRVEALLEILEASRRDLDPRVRDVESLLGRSDARSGQTVGPFMLARKIGEGDLGVVFSAERVGNALEEVEEGGAIFVKVLHPEAARDRRVLQRFLTTSRILAEVKHPGLPTLLEAGESDGGRAFVAYSAFEGQSLAQRLARTGPSPHQRAAPHSARHPRASRRAARRAQDARRPAARERAHRAGGRHRRDERAADGRPRRRDRSAPPASSAPGRLAQAWPSDRQARHGPRHGRDARPRADPRAPLRPARGRLRIRRDDVRARLRQAGLPRKRRPRAFARDAGQGAGAAEQQGAARLGPQRRRCVRALAAVEGPGPPPPRRRGAARGPRLARSFDLALGAPPVGRPRGAGGAHRPARLVADRHGGRHCARSGGGARARGDRDRRSVPLRGQVARGDRRRRPRGEKGALLPGCPHLRPRGFGQGCSRGSLPLDPRHRPQRRRRRERARRDLQAPRQVRGGPRALAGPQPGRRSR